MRVVNHTGAMNMRRTFLKLAAACALSALSLTAVIAQSASGDVSGQWDGGWEGAGGAGSFKITLTRGSDGKLSGGVSVGQDSGDYKATFTSVTVEGNTITAKYDYTPDPQAEIALTGTMEGNTLKGAWKMLPKGQEMELAAGTWSVTKTN